MRAARVQVAALVLITDDEGRGAHELSKEEFRIRADLAISRCYFYTWTSIFGWHSFQRYVGIALLLPLLEYVVCAQTFCFGLPVRCTICEGRFREPTEDMSLLGLPSSIKAPVQA